MSEDLSSVGTSFLLGLLTTPGRSRSLLIKLPFRSAAHLPNQQHLTTLTTAQHAIPLATVHILPCLKL